MYAQLELRNPFGKVIATSSAYICWGETLVYDYPPDEPCATLELNCYSVPSCIATAALVITEPNSTLIDGFLSRHNSETGEMLWGVQFGSSSCDVPYAVDISPWDSGVYVVGGTRGSLYSTQIGSEDEIQ
jgi:outer membrane protein assembly factor BamB